jgi:hypothetical protein
LFWDHYYLCKDHKRKPKNLAFFCSVGFFFEDAHSHSPRQHLTVSTDVFPNPTAAVCSQVTGSGWVRAISNRVCNLLVLTITMDHSALLVITFFFFW